MNRSVERVWKCAIDGNGGTSPRRLAAAGGKVLGCVHRAPEFGLVMGSWIALISFVVRDYDEAIEYFVGKLGFALVEDRPDRRSAPPHAPKRWVIVAPPGSVDAALLLARAEDETQRARVGDQTGGRVAFFLHTDDFARDHTRYLNNGVEFTSGAPRDEPYGRVAVFRDLYGNLWDLIEPTDPAQRHAARTTRSKPR